MLHHCRFLIVIFLTTSLLGACASAPPAADNSTKIPKDVFLQLMEDRSAKALCEAEKYRSCLGVSQKRCESEIAAVVPKCTDQMMKTMPDFVASREDGRRYGEEYGKCVIMRQIAYGKHDLQKIKTCKK